MWVVGSCQYLSYFRLSFALLPLKAHSQVSENFFQLKSVFHWQFLITSIFSVSLKFRVCYIKGQWGAFFVVFHHKICVFIIFVSFLWQSIEFPQKNINQSETGIYDKKLSVKLFVKFFYMKNAFYFTLSALFVLKIFNFNFDSLVKRSD